MAPSRKVETDPRAVRARELKEEGIPQRDIARELGVSPNTIRRWTDHEYLVRSRKESNEYKKKQGHGKCIDCGAPTSFNGHYPKGHPLYYSLRCPSCSHLNHPNIGKRGTGKRAKKIIAYLQEHGPSYFAVMRDNLETDSNNLGVELNRLRKHGIVVRISRGLYALPGQADENIISAWEGFDYGRS